MGSIDQQVFSPDKQRLARMLKALGNPVRFQIVEFLASHPTCITNGIVNNTPLAQSTISQHLKVLRDSGLVAVREEGQHRYYRLEPSPLEAIEDWIIPFLSADVVILGNDAGSTAFAAWAGSSLPKPLRKVAETIEHPSDAGTAVGRSVADASHQVRAVIEGATQRIEEASAKVEKKVIDPLREKLGRHGDGTK